MSEQAPEPTEVNVEAEQVVVNTAPDGGGNDGDNEHEGDE